MVGKAIRRWWPLFALPTFLAFIIGFIVPFIMGIYLSFNKFIIITNLQWVGWSNYTKVFSDPQFVHSLWYTVIFTVITTVIINVLGFLVAYLLTKVFKGTNLFRSVFFMPNLIGGIVLGYVWQLLLNAILLHWEKDLTSSEWYGLAGLVILVCWQQIGYMMIVYIAGLQNLPTDVLEAADVDGASSSQKLFHVIIPLMMPSITVCSFLTVTNGFKLFDQNLSLTSGMPSHNSEMLALNIYNTFYNSQGVQQGVGQAKAVVFFIVVAVIAIIQNRLTTRKEVAA
jgi:raffinose/stachyose/melibiose transport system permease protein